MNTYQLELARDQALLVEAQEIGWSAKKALTSDSVRFRFEGLELWGFTTHTGGSRRVRYAARHKTGHWYDPVGLAEQLDCYRWLIVYGDWIR